MGAEGLHLAVFFTAGPWSFDLRKVAPSWVEEQVRWDARSDTERNELVQRSLVFIYSRILPDLDRFLDAVCEQEEKLRSQRRQAG